PSRPRLRRSTETPAPSSTRRWPRRSSRFPWAGSSRSVGTSICTRRRSPARRCRWPADGRQAEDPRRRRCRARGHPLRQRPAGARVLSIGYGVVYDYIFERFLPYQRLEAEVRQRVEASVPPSVDRHGVRILDIACGPGNFACLLAEAGFSVIGLDTYASLVEVAKE